MKVLCGFAHCLVIVFALLSQLFGRCLVVIWLFFGDCLVVVWRLVDVWLLCSS